MIAARVTPAEAATPDKERACREIDRHRRRLTALSHAIHARPEPAFAERWAAGAITGVLAERGFTIEQPLLGLPTAFRASIGPRDGPTVILCAEYDALPGIGHGCGHNIVATTAIGAALGLASLARRLGGRVVVLGTPAEEGGGGKIILARRGAFAGARAVMLVHPDNRDVVTPVLRAAVGYRAVLRGRAAHAGRAPEDGRNALDAAVLGYTAVGALRASLHEGDQVSITLCGAGPPNVVPAQASVRLLVRSATASGLAAVAAQVRRCFEGGAHTAGCTLRFGPDGPAYHHLKADEALARAFARNAAAVGRALRPGVPSDLHRAGSTDLGIVSHLAPTIHPMLAVAPADVALHTAAFARHAVSPRADRAVLDGAKAMAMTALDVWHRSGRPAPLPARRDHWPF